MPPTRATPRASESSRARLTRLMRSGLLSTAYQPIIDLTAIAVVGLEALARPCSGTGFRDPTDLFDTADLSGWSPAVESAAICRALESLPPLPDPCQLFLNCSPAALSCPRFARSLARRIADAGLCPEQIVIEVTERRDDVDDTLPESCQSLRRLGFRIALDDVGAGASGLSRLIALRPDWIKLDRELVQSTDHDPLRRNLVRALARFGDNAGIKVIAEGVETPSQLRALSECGIRFVQGFLLARPHECPASLTPQIRAEIRSLGAPWARSMSA